MKKFLAGVAVGALLVGSAATAAGGFQTDWLVMDLQNSFHMTQGGMIPANPSYPMAPRLRYLGTKIYPGDVYAVYLKHVY